jgi:hypothetical protein
MTGLLHEREFSRKSFLKGGGAMVVAGDEFEPFQGAWLLELGESIDPAVHKGSKPLLSIAPNPLGSLARISFELSTRQRTVLTIHDLQGRRVRKLLDAAIGPGRYSFWWDGLDEQGARCRAGVYFCELSSSGTRSEARMVLIP